MDAGTYRSNVRPSGKSSIPCCGRDPRGDSAPPRSHTRIRAEIKLLPFRQTANLAKAFRTSPPNEGSASSQSSSKPPHRRECCCIEDQPFLSGRIVESTSDALRSTSACALTVSSTARFFWAARNRWRSTARQILPAFSHAISSADLEQPIRESHQQSRRGLRSARAGPDATPGLRRGAIRRFVSRSGRVRPPFAVDESEIGSAPPDVHWHCFRAFPQVWGLFGSLSGRSSCTIEARRTPQAFTRRLLRRSSASTQSA